LSVPLQLVICPKCGEAFDISKIVGHVIGCQGRLGGAAQVALHETAQEEQHKEGGA
jgi:hypothetical protein